MTVNELIKQLQDLPLQQRERRVAIYIDGCISGILDIHAVEPADPANDSDYPMISTVRFTEAK